MLFCVCETNKQLLVDDAFESQYKEFEFRNVLLAVYMIYQA